MRRMYQGAGLVILAFSAWVMWEAHKLNYSTSLGPGPGFFPFWLGLALALLSLLWLFRVSSQEQAAMPEGFIPSGPGVLRMLAVVGAMVVFALFMNTIGFQLMMFAFLLFLLTVLGRRSIFLTLVICFAGSFGLFYVFTNYMDVSLPVSSIMFLKDIGF